MSWATRRRGQVLGYKGFICCDLRWVSNIYASLLPRHPMTTPQHLVANAVRKPGKPSPDFPLFAHNNGQWAKKIGGRIHYFGPWRNPQAALRAYHAYIKGPPNEPQCGRIPSKAQSDKPAKPHPDFPLYSHASGKWAKKIRGKTYYFGSWDDPDGALERYLELKDELLAGRTPSNGDGLTIRELANRFLSGKRSLVDNGELAERSWFDYLKTTPKGPGAW